MGDLSVGALLRAYQLLFPYFALESIEQKGFILALTSWVETWEGGTGQRRGKHVSRWSCRITVTSAIGGIWPDFEGHMQNMKI